jgi:phage terminase large subunit
MIAHRRRNKRRDMAPTCDVDMPADAVMTRGIGDNKPPEPIFCPTARAFQDLYRTAPVKVFYGGRGSGKSWAIARYLIGIARKEKTRIGCFREYQSSIADSVHRLLTDQIWAMGLQHEFHITEKSIVCLLTGTEFIFKGLRKSIQEVKSTEGIKYTWVEEAQNTSEESWQILLPTVARVAGAELIVSFNPDAETDPTYKRFVMSPDGDWIVRHVNFNSNPWFARSPNGEDTGMEKLRMRDFALDPDAYDWIWEGKPRKLTDAIIFRSRVVFDTFEAPEGVRYHQGLDFGFANDPNAFIRSFILDDELYISEEVFGYQVEIDDLPKMIAGKAGATEKELLTWNSSWDAKWPGVKDAKQWPIRADNARPETISYLARMGFNIQPADKWPGSIEDGVAHLKAFKKIHIHAVRCPNMAREARLYSYKVDKKTNDILPEIVDKWNHGWDATRYSLDGYIQRRGTHGAWLKAFKD